MQYYNIKCAVFSVASLLCIQNAAYEIHTVQLADFVCQPAGVGM